MANDYGLHDFRDTDAGSMLRVKGSDTLCPLGPGLVTDWDFHGKRIQTRVNGDVKQDGNTDEMIWDMRYLVADIARTITLLPNDVILSGTPANSRPVEPGDVVEVEVEGLGILRNFIVEGDVPVREDVGAQPSESEEVISTAFGGRLGVPGHQSPEAGLSPTGVDLPVRSVARYSADSYPRSRFAAASATFRGDTREARDMDLSGRRLRLLIPDILGLERGKYLFGDVAESGHAAFCIGLYPLTTDREILPIPRQQFDVGLPDVEAQLDRDTLRPGWEDDTMVGIGDVTQHGKPLEVDPRHVLQQAIQAWRDMGLEPQMAYELEFYLCERAEDGTWAPADLPSHRVYGTGMSVDPSGAVHDMVSASLASGFAVESWCSEFDSAAFEVNWRYRDALEAADEASSSGCSSTRSPLGTAGSPRSWGGRSTIAGGAACT